MNIILSLVDFVLHIDKHLGAIIQNYGTITYIILFLIIFCETGLVFLPFLPGDSLIFAAAAFSAIGSLNFWILYFVVLFAAFIGDSVNYEIGKKLGNKLDELEENKLIKKKYIVRTQRFFERHGGKAIVLARFVPIVRTFAPFVAGTGKMHYFKFLRYNLLGSFLWVSLCTFSGYFFGNIPFIKKNFSVVILTIIFISLMPIIIAYFVNKRKNKLKDLNNKEVN